MSSLGGCLREVEGGFRGEVKGATASLFFLYFQSIFVTNNANPSNPLLSGIIQSSFPFILFSELSLVEIHFVWTIIIYIYLPNIQTKRDLKTPH